MANKLINATSPYLLQHAHNPVHWYEWGAEALEKAKKEDKPILVSIGYSSCHWCHVMERESFENNDIAQIMNEYFVCMKVDREERPDIDQIYMEAVQVMGLNGGWPLNVFLTPDQKPFYGGTYFPPPNWSQLLLQINKAFQQNRKEVNTSADELAKHIGVSDLQRFGQSPAEGGFQFADLDLMFNKLEPKFDKVWGGMDRAPKFVMPTIWLFLLRYYAITKNERALELVNLTLTKMASAGLYDQIGGGFSRYSVDGEWFAPHFEKMLYDNAQLLSLYSEAYAITKNEFFKEIIYASIGWLKREMTHDDGGFYSALDADSEGVEGKFYTWTEAELKEVLGEKAQLIMDHYKTQPLGNWEHGRSIFIRSSDKEPDAILPLKEKLLLARNNRIHPGLDDKILTGWNAMTIIGLIDAYKVFTENHFLLLAEKSIQFIENHLIINGKLHRSFKNKSSATEGFLEDYAFMISAYIALYQATFNEAYLRKAQQWTNYTIGNFYDEAEGYFFFSGKNSEQLIAQKKEIFDNVIPSSNSVMARALYHLAIILDHSEWKIMALKMVAGLSSLIKSEPGNMSNWGIALAEMTRGMAEVVMVGKDAESWRAELHLHYKPFALVMGTETGSTLPLFENRQPTGDQSTIYVCFGKHCKLPVHSVNDALTQLQE